MREFVVLSFKANPLGWGHFPRAQELCVTNSCSHFETLVACQTIFSKLYSFNGILIQLIRSNTVACDRVLYAFDPRRKAILLVGGCKTGDEAWYDTFVPIADRLVDDHLEILRNEGEL